MSDKPNKCVIKVPVALYVDSNESEDINDLVYVILLLSVDCNNNSYICKKYLDLDEAKQIIFYLEKSVDYFKTLQEDNSLNLDNLIESSIEIINDNQIEEEVEPIGKLTIDENSEKKPYIIVDVAKKIDRLGTRLIIFDKIILCCWLTIEEVEKLINGFLLSISSLEKNPPSIVRNLHLGKVKAFDSTMKEYWINIEVDDDSIYEQNASGIVLDITEVEEDDGLSNTWWIDNVEASKLLNIFRKIKTNLYPNNSTIGFLGENLKSAWLTIRVEKEPLIFKKNNISSHNYNWIRLVFDDELVREDENNKNLWLTLNDVENLNKYLFEAIKNQANSSSSFSLSSQVEDSVIFELIL